MAVPLDSYTPMHVREVSSGRDVTVYNQTPAYARTYSIRCGTTWRSSTANYNGVDLNFRKRLSNRWMIMGGASFGQNEGDIYGGNSI